MLIVGTAHANLAGSHRATDTASCTATEKAACHSSCSRISCHKCRCSRCHFCRRLSTSISHQRETLVRRINSTTAGSDIVPDRSGGGGASEQPSSSGVLSFLAVYLTVISWCTYRSLRSPTMGLGDDDVETSDAQVAKSHQASQLDQGRNLRAACSTALDT